jgi:hypothetical protein
MSSADNNNKMVRQSRLRKILEGIDTHFGGTGSLTLGRVTYTLADLKATIQDDIDASDASVKAKAALSAAVQTERDKHARVDPILRLLRFYVISQFGDTKDTSGFLADFGLAPRKVAQKTVATKSEAIAKTKATRDARHTAGKKQKARLRGTVPAAAAKPAERAREPSPAPNPPPSDS